MSFPISSLLGVSSTIAPSRVTSLVSGGKNESFGSVLTSAIQSVDAQQQHATTAIQDFLDGKGELHNVAMTTQRAEMAFDLGMQIRNKVVSAYQEIMKMQL
jgi:flagellar hook-basal body complex protein FliE